MQIDVRKDGSKLILAPKGNIDYVTAPELDAEVSKAGDDVRSIEIDMSGVPYISSAGLRVILNADELMQDRDGIKLTGVNNDVRAILEMTGFYDMLDIERCAASSRTAPRSRTRGCTPGRTAACRPGGGRGPTSTGSPGTATRAWSPGCTWAWSSAGTGLFP